MSASATQTDAVQTGAAPSIPLGYPYKAFLSYSHAADSKLAPAIQTGLHRLGKPWYKIRAVRVFRDKTDLSANPALWSSIETALSMSEFFPVLVSPAAARSHWIQREVHWWTTNSGVSKMLILLTEGQLAWDAQAGDFDWNKTTALPPSLTGRFKEEPLWVDLSWAKSEEQLTLSSSQFRSAVLEIAAPVHGAEKGDLDGEDVRQDRRMWRMMWLTAAVLVLLTIAAITGWARARYLVTVAEERLRVATSRQLAATALLHRDDRLDLASLLSMEALRIAQTSEARDALLVTFESNPRLMTFLHNTSSMRSLAFSPDGKLLASAGDDGIVRLWDVASRQSQGQPLKGHTKSVKSVAFSPDGNLLASASDDGTVRLWKVASRQPFGESLQGHTSDVNSLVFSPDGRLLASAGDDGIVRLWDVASRQFQGQPLKGHTRSVNNLAFTPEGKMLASGGADAAVRLWDVVRQQPYGEPLQGHAGTVAAVAFSPDGA